MSDFTKKEIDEELLVNSKILIIEDSRTGRLLLRHILEKCGFINIEEAKDGLEGWNKTLEIEPDLVLLDINMPVMNGIEYCKKARSNKSFKDLAIIVQTGLHDLKENAKVFEYGATDYVAKPIDEHEITARIFIHLERSVYIKKLELFQKRINKELVAAKSLVESTLPSEEDIEAIKKKYGISLASEFKASQEMGGDFWGFYPINEARLAVYNIDISGHGIDSALNALRVHSIIHSNTNKLEIPGVFLEWLNNKLCNLFPVGQFATMFYGVIDIKENTISYATAASPDPFLVNMEEGEIVNINGQGFPLGVRENADFKTNVLDFNKNNFLMLYSDALVESVDMAGDMFGEERLGELVSKYGDKESFYVKEYLNKLLSKFQKECGKDLSDDLTINVYHRD